MAKAKKNQLIMHEYLEYCEQNYPETMTEEDIAEAHKKLDEIEGVLSDKGRNTVVDDPEAWAEALQYNRDDLYDLYGGRNDD